LVLKALIEARLAMPGRALPPEALFAAGWPGEQAHPEAERNRVYAALSELRRLGLRELLQSRDDGYLLDPGRSVTRE
jgi:hypothetical protein